MNTEQTELRYYSLLNLASPLVINKIRLLELFFHNACIQTADGFLISSLGNFSQKEKAYLKKVSFNKKKPSKLLNTDAFLK